MTLDLIKSSSEKEINAMTREAIYKEMKETLGSVFGFFEVLDDTQLGPMWEKIKKTFLSDMSQGLKGNALAAVAASFSSECTH